MPCTIRTFDPKPTRTWLARRRALEARSCFARYSVSFAERRLSPFHTWKARMPGFCIKSSCATNIVGAALTLGGSRQHAVGVLPIR